MSQYELDTFLTATDGVGFSNKRKFYQTGYGFGFNQYFWIEIGIEPPVVVPPTSLGGGGIASYPPVRPYTELEQVHYVKFFIKTPSGEIVSKRWEIKKTTYKFLMKLIGSHKFIPTFVLKQMQVVTNIYHKIKVKLIH